MLWSRILVECFVFHSDSDMKFKGIPVLFIPGNAGSYKQGWWSVRILYLCWTIDLSLFWCLVEPFRQSSVSYIVHGPSASGTLIHLHTYRWLNCYSLWTGSGSQSFAPSPPVQLQDAHATRCKVLISRMFAAFLVIILINTLGNWNVMWKYL